MNKLFSRDTRLASTAVLRACVSGQPLITALVLASLTITLALASQYGGGLIPCDLCHKQRWPYYIGIPILLVTAFLPGRSRQVGLALGGAVFLFSVILASYHVGVEQKFWPGPATCGGGLAMPETIEDLHNILARGAVSCDKPAFTLFGISMAGYNALISFIILGLLYQAFRNDKGNA